MATADHDEDRREEIYFRRDTGYYSELTEAVVLSPSRPVRVLSPIPSDRLSPSARRLLGRTSPDDIQREIDAVQQKIDVLSARSVRHQSRERGSESSTFDNGGHIVASDSPPCLSDRSEHASDLSDKRRAPDRPKSSGRPRSDRPTVSAEVAVPDKPTQDGGKTKQAEIEKAIPTTKRENSNRSLPTIKLGTFDGTTPLETFLAKFTNCCEYSN